MVAFLMGEMERILRSREARSREAMRRASFHEWSYQSLLKRLRIISRDPTIVVRCCTSMDYPDGVCWWVDSDDVWIYAKGGTPREAVEESLILCMKLRDRYRVKDREEDEE